ncbi:MAG: LPS sulfotransferase NodH [Phycisphaerales bacterium]|jgi:LPS sulfotransferase NodH
MSVGTPPSPTAPTAGPAAGPVAATGPVLVVSHERSGTHLLIDALRRNFAACCARPKRFANPHDWIYFSADRLREGHPRAVGTNAAERALARAQRPILKAHMTPDFPGLRPENREWFLDRARAATTLHLHRDGRDVLCSYHRLRLRASAETPPTVSAFLRSKVEGHNVVRFWAEHTRAWLEAEDAVSIAFESLLTEPDATLQSIARALGLARKAVARPLPERGTSPWPARFSRLTGRLESSNLVSLGPVGLPGRWQDAFTRDDRAYFHEQAGEILQRLGYADSEGWIDRDPARPGGPGG